MEGDTKPMDDDEHPSPQARGTKRKAADLLTPNRLVGGMAVIIAAIAAVLVVSLYQSYEDTRLGAERNALTLASKLSEDVERIVLALDGSLQTAAEAWRRAQAGKLSDEARAALLFDYSARSSDARVAVVDAHGQLIADAKSAAPEALNLSDQLFFRSHRESEQIGLYVEPITKTPLDEDWSLVISRRITNADGTFGGVGVASIRISEFRTLYSALLDHPDVSVVPQSAGETARALYKEANLGLILLDPTYRAEWKAKPAITFREDGKDRAEELVAVHVVGDLLLLQVVSLPWRAIFHDWWMRTYGFAASFGILALAVGALTVFAARSLARRIKEEADLAALARTDALTTLGNRRAFDEMLRYAWWQSKASDDGALMMIDVDYFKRYNDMYGHPAGDAVLAQVGVCIAESLSRPTDFAARYGGEEFAVLLPNSSAQRALVVATRIKDALAARAVDHDGSPIGRLTISIGIAMRSSCDEGDEAALVKAADQALYRAKESGRNRIVQAHEPPEPTVEAA